jgi:pyruvate/2-oxoglutarate dehydrogenase complex dihydrolipoamide dehydrogenase (E3) component
MPDVEKYENLVVGSGAGGQWLTWSLAGTGHRSAVVEREGKSVG